MGFGVNSKKSDKEEKLDEIDERKYRNRRPSKRRVIDEDDDDDDDYDDEDDDYESYKSRRERERKSTKSRGQNRRSRNINSRSMDREEKLGGRAKTIKKSSSSTKYIIIGGLIGVAVLGGIIYMAVSGGVSTSNIANTLKPTNVQTSKQASLFTPTNGSSSSSNGSSGNSSTTNSSGSANSSDPYNPSSGIINHPNVANFDDPSTNNQTGQLVKGPVIKDLEGKEIPFHFEVSDDNRDNIAYVKYTKECIQTAPGVEFLLLKGTWKGKTVYLNPPFYIWNALSPTGSVACKMEVVSTGTDGMVTTHFSVIPNATQMLQTGIENEKNNNNTD